METLSRKPESGNIVGWAKRSVPNINLMMLRSLGTLRFAQPTGKWLPIFNFGLPGSG